MQLARQVDESRYIPFEPLDWQIEPLNYRGDVLLLTGSAGGGKSRCAAEKLHAYCLKYPGTTALMLRKTRESCKNSIVTFMDRIVIGDDPRVHHAPGYSRFEYHNGSILIYGGMKNEEQRESVRSIGLAGGVDIAWMEEATQFAEGDFNEVLARLRGQAGGFRQVILTTNPDNPYHWIYKRVITGGEGRVKYSHARDNLFNPPDYEAVTLQKLTGVQKQRLVEGKWVQAEGICFSEWNPDVHLIDELPGKPWDYEYYASVDWGFRNPGVIQVWALDYDERLYLVAEVYHTGRTIDWWIEQAGALDKEYEIERWFCDPAEPAYIDQFQNSEHDLMAEGANNTVRAGIDAVNDRLKIKADKQPGLYVVRGAGRVMGDEDVYPDPALVSKYAPIGLVEEIPGYVWADPKGGEVKEKPVKINDHACDTTRYICMHFAEAQGVYAA